MVNRIRFVIALTVLVGIVGEFATGMLPPQSAVQLGHASRPSIRHLVEVDLPTVEQALPWCYEAQAVDPSRHRMDCDFR